MKASDLIGQLRAVLPTKTDFFSAKVGVVSVSKAALVATVTTSGAHGLVVGEYVTVNGVLSPVQIDTVTETATSYELNTLTPHDQTLHPVLDTGKTIRITGAGYDQVFEITDVPNRFRLTIKKDGQQALPMVVLYLQESSLIGYNGLKQVSSVPTATSFTFVMDFELPQPNYVNGSWVYLRHRISGAVSVDVLMDSYTNQANNELWAFVVLDSVDANKDRRTVNDATTTQGRQGDFEQKIICNFSVFVFVPNKGEVLTKTNGRAGRDLIEDIRKPLLQSLLGIKAPASLTAQGQGVITYNGDDFHLYNDAFYVHQFSFQQVDEITIGDTAIVSFDRAFRDVDLTIFNQFSDVTEYTALVNLDDEPEV